MTVQAQIESIIRDALQPAVLEVENESYMHNVPPGSESHFRLLVVCAGFQGVPRVRRHQQIYGLLKQQTEGAVHALALHTYTPEEWSKRQQVPESPACLGGETGRQR